MARRTIRTGLTGGTRGLGKAQTLRVGRRAVAVSSLDKVLFPDIGLTKGDLIAYYHEAAHLILPHLADRPLVMHRFPDGIEGQGFFQKEVSDYFPDWIERVTVRKEGGTVTHAVCSDQASLVYLVNQNMITPHVWLSRTDKLHHPDRLVFDLDPSGLDFEPVREGARAFRDLLRELGLDSYLMTTGGRGLHVVTPLDRKAEFKTVRGFARAVADLLAARDPRRFTTESRKEQRKGRVFLDYLRNGYAQTVVAPFGVRARPGGPVAMPIPWEQLDEHDLRGDRYRVRNVVGDLARAQDPWKGIGRKGHSLVAARKRLDRLTAQGRPR